MKFTVIVFRPLWFKDMDTVCEFPDLQYVATEIEAPNAKAAGRAAVKEAFAADAENIANYLQHWSPVTEDGHDMRKVKPSDYTVIGSIAQGGDYKPWYTEPTT